MKGLLGSFHKGDLQIGGILSWTLDLVLADYQRDAATYHNLVKWKLAAQGYWLFDTPPDTIVIRLYPDAGRGYWEGVGRISPPIQKIFDTLIHSQIELIGESIFEGKQ